MQARGRKRRAIEDGVEDDAGGFAAKGERSRGHFVEDGAEGEEVGPGVEFLAANLFGRHVGHGSESGAGAGEMFGIDAEGGESSGRLGFRTRVGNFGEAEIENFGVGAFGDEDVGGLDVAVNDAFGVSGFEGVGDFDDGEVEEAVELEGTAGDEILTGLAFETFHGDEGLSVFFADIVDGADVGVVEGGGGFGFAAKTAEGLGIFGERVREKFEGDEAVEARVLRLVDDAHAAAAEHLGHAIVRDGLSD